MKLIKAEIEGFGQLANEHLSLDAPIVVIYGPNEAGKSTMFSFIRTMLYGFARRGQAVLRQEPIYGGRHGGRLFIADQTGASYVVERYAADNSGKLRLRLIGDSAGSGQLGKEEEQSLLAGDKALDQTEWEKRFLGGVSEKLYRQLFAVTLTELQEVGALAGDELGRYLYQAGWDNGKSIATAEKRLAQELDALFKPRGSNQRMNQQLRTLEQAEAALRKRTDAIAAYNDLMKQAGHVDDQLMQLGEALPHKEAAVRLLGKACSARPLWLRKQKLLLERKPLAYSSTLSAQSEKGWTELIRQREECREIAERNRQQLQQLELQRGTIQYDEGLLSLKDETEALQQSAESYRRLTQDQVELEAELREHDEAIARLVSSIAPEWTLRQLREFHVTISDRDYVRGVRQREADMLRTEERLAAELEAAQEQEREAAYALEEAELAADREALRREQAEGGGFAFLPRTQEALKGAWNAFDRALREWELERARRASAAEDASDSEAAGRGAAAAGRRGAGALWAAAAGAGGAALALGFAALSGGGAAGEAAGGAGIAAALALAIAALVLAAAALLRSRSGGRAARAEGRAAEAGGGAMSRRRARSGAAEAASEWAASALRAREESVQRALEALLREPAEAAASLLAGRQDSAAEHALAAEQLRTQLRAAVEACLEAMQAGGRLADSRRELQQRLSRLQALVAERRAAADAAAQARQAAAREWAGWLTERGLPTIMTPTAALEAFELAEQAVQRLHQYDRLAARQHAIRKQIAAFDSQAAQLCEPFEEAERQLAVDPVLAVQLLHAEIRRHAAAAEEVRTIETRRSELQLALQAAEATLAELQADVNRQMSAAGIDNEADYTAALLHRQQLAELDLELSQLELEMTAGMSSERIAELEGLYAANDEEQLLQQHAAAKAELAQLEERKRELLEQRGSLRQSIDYLMKEDEQQRLLVQKEMTIAQLEADMERYAVLSVSAALIRATKRIFEEERQPVVLKHASRYIATLTEGKYIRVLAAPGEQGIRLESKEHRLVDSSMLSRGTAEQLYLAMRFALAVEASQSEKLPIMLDDVFVNFDYDRLQAAARLVAELSEDRQIIIMTCHKHVSDALLRHGAGASLVRFRGKPVNEERASSE